MLTSRRHGRAMRLRASLGLFLVALRLTASYPKRCAHAQTPCGGVAEWLKAAVLKTVKPQGFVGSNPTASARNAARPEPAGSGRFSLFGPAFRLELPAHERMFHVKHSRGGRFARLEPASAAHDWAAHAQQNRRFGRPSPSPSIEGNTRPGVLPTSLAPSVLKPR